MDSDKKIKLLVIPDLFPKFEGDAQGIFILDYLKAVKDYCTTNVLFLRLVGKKGLTVDANDDYTTYRYCVSSKKIPAFLKPFAYLIWFIRGYRLGKKFTDTDIIHSHGSILSGTLSYILSKKLKVPFIITEHQGPFSMTSDNFWKLRWTRFIMQKADAVLTVSDHLKQEILNSGIHPKKIIVTYNPVDTDLFQPKTNTEITNNILFVGRLDNFKGGLRCVKAFEKITEKYPLFTFTIVGDGEDYVPIKNYIKGKPFKERIILKGGLSKVEIAKEMQKADFFVFPSRHESFGLVIAEAISCGLPVIVGNQTAPKEYVSKDCGLLVPPDDIDAMANAMEQLLGTFTSYNASVMHQQMVADFGFDAFGKRLKFIYEEGYK
ncbi:MAG TPA: glycosyltransferase family 4 protein [Bacteroidia bacterium]|nr:glycosyltransferase family 4 protein [Bacteroidia bacterium]